MAEEPHIGNLHTRALELVRQAYENAVGMDRLDLDYINSVRPPGLRLHSASEAIREQTNAAGGAAGLAVRLGLITSAEVAEIMRTFFADHPELVDQDDEDWLREHS